LFYGAGYGRLAGADGSGRGNAVYDTAGLPIWVAAGGLALPDAGSGTGTSAGSGTGSGSGTVTDQLVNGTPGDDYLRGGAGADTLNGLGASDDLQGGAGDDRLAGGRDHDGLTLGAGRDTVVFARGDADDWVVDFIPGEDRLLIQGYAAAEAAIRPATFWGMAGTEIQLAGGDRLFLQGVSALGADDVVFG
jgi:Ca2+-binding RTX toxin-like protein